MGKQGCIHKMDILRTVELKKSFLVRKNVVKALDGVDIFLRQGEATALVGESGCGKTTLAKILLGFYAIDSGKIFFEDKDISCLKHNLRIIRENIQIVFQNPYLSFDSRYSAFSALYEVLRTFNKLDKDTAKDIIIDILHRVGLGAGVLSRYPHSLSGGELQRISIARALIKKPRVVILDEPTSNLDISTTVEIINLLEGLKEKESLSYLFISHDLKLVAKIANYIFVMYYGKIVEYGLKDALYHNPCHPYTKLLIEASEYKLKDVCIQIKHKEGCIFRGRCVNEKSRCKVEPRKREIEPGHFVFCHYA